MTAPDALWEEAAVLVAGGHHPAPEDPSAGKPWVKFALRELARAFWP